MIQGGGGGMRRPRHPSSSDITVSVRNNLANCYRCITFHINYNVTSVVQFVNDRRDAIVEQLNEYVDGNFKMQNALRCHFISATSHEPREWFLSNSASKYNGEWLDNQAEQLDSKISNYANISSGYTIDSILEYSIILVRCEDFSRLNGHAFIKTPEILFNKKCIVNVQNNDNLCFLYSILAVLHYDNHEIPKNHRYRMCNYTPYLHTLNYDPTDFPMRICNISKFEKFNNALKINVIKYIECDESEEEEEQADENAAYTNPHFQLIYKSSVNNPNARPINLLLVEGWSTFHYMAITNLDKLLNSHNRHNSRSRIRNRWCRDCLRGFRKELAFDKHIPLCKLGATQVCTMPTDPIFKFKNFSKTISPAYVVYADFESVLEVPVNTPESAIETHMPIAAALLMIPARKDLRNPLPIVYRDFFNSNCIVEFLETLEELSGQVQTWYHENGNLEIKPLTPMQVQSHDNATICYLCHNKVVEKVRDHNHFTGEYIGAACNKCNLSRRNRYPFLPVMFHNLRGYDMHHILKHAINQFPQFNITCIPQSSEKFMSLTANNSKKGHAQIRFLDTLQFLNASLHTLVSSLANFPHTFTLPYPSDVLTSKGIFPYSYASSTDDLMHCQHLPPKLAFLDSLTQKVSITDNEYQMALRTWNIVGCQNLKDYLMFYLKLDIYLLCDVFEAFRETALDEDQLDPLNFYSIPGLSLCSAMKKSRTEIELLQDYSMYTFFEEGIRGGMTFINKHHVVSDVNTSMLYIDINNLYGWSLSQMLPVKNFKFIYDATLLNNILHDLPNLESPIGYVFEVDLHFPMMMHDKTDQLPLAPVMQCPPGSKIRKLLLTHEPKENYIIHYALLKFFMNLGATVEKVHRAVSFSQAPIFKSYVDYNTQKRALTNEKFKKDYYKLKNNSLYGKTVENVRKRKNIRLCNSDKKLLTYASKPTFRKSIDICDNLVAALMIKENIILDKPVFIGQAVLDLSKLRMYRLQYIELENYRNEFNCEINIVAADTDSFFLECKNVALDSLLSAMVRDHILDTSNYPITHPLYSREHANEIGLFKDESEGDRYKEWIFLRPKCYSLLKEDDTSNRKAKGVIRDVVRNRLQHERYKEVYEQGVDIREKQRRIGSKNHQLYTMETDRMALSRRDDKRHWVANNQSLAYGHYIIGMFDDDDDGNDQLCT